MFEIEKGLKVCKTILKKIGAWGFLLMDDKMYLFSHCHVKKMLQNLSYF